MAEFRNTAQPDRDWWSALWGDPADTLDVLGIDGGSLVDLCCGDGYFTVDAARRCDPVYGVDLEPELLAALDQRASDAGVAIETIEADARNLESAIPEPVDTVLLANTLHGVPDRRGSPRSSTTPWPTVAGSSSSTGTTSPPKKRRSSTSHGDRPGNSG